MLKLGDPKNKPGMKQIKLDISNSYFLSFKRVFIIILDEKINAQKNIVGNTSKDNTSIPNLK